MNFNLVEGNSTLEFETTYAQIKKDISNGMLIKDIKRKYNINAGRWVKYRKQLVRDGIVRSKSDILNNGKQYYWNKSNRKWVVYKTVNGRKLNFGGYKEEEDAKKIVKELRKCGWDKNQLSEIREKVL